MVSDCGDAGVAGSLLLQYVFGPSERIVAVVVVSPVDLGAGGDEQPNALDRPERGGEVQRAAR
jgi:hypothetical protein